MKSKIRLLRVSSTIDYIFCFLWFVVSACLFSLSSRLCILFAVLGMAALYDGLLVNSLKEDLLDGCPEEHETLRQVFGILLGAASPVSLILTLVALCTKQASGEPVPASRREEAPLLRASSGKTSRKVLCVSLCVVFLASFIAMCFDTSGFTVEISDFTLTKEMTARYQEGMINGKPFVMENDTTYAVTMYKPKTATEEHPAATVFVMPGFTRTKATMAQYCIELSRRGFVAFCLDPSSQGSTTETSTVGANGAEFLVQYVYNNPQDFNFCDKSRFGAVGHSAAGGNVSTLAADFSGETFEDSVIRSVYISGYIKPSSTRKYSSFRCNAGLAYAYYDEGAYRHQTEESSIEVASLQFINEVNGQDLGYRSVVVDEPYGDIHAGTYRIFHREKTNHCFEMYDPLSITNTINFFDETLLVNSGLDGSRQIWFGKEFFNGVALAAAFAFVLSLCGVLMTTSFFRTIKPENAPGGPEAAWERGSVGHKIVFWSTMILGAAIACLDYIPLANLSIEIFPVGNHSNVFTFVFPARMINAILLWATVNGVIGFLLYFGTTVGENIYEYFHSKRSGAASCYDWVKMEYMKIRRTDSSALVNTLKTILLSLILFCSFYLLVHLNFLLFHEDFRFTLISASPINPRTFVTALEYIPIIFIFYLSNAVRVNGSIARQGWKEWQTLLVAGLANCIGLVFILIINYFCFFQTGAPFYDYRGDGNEVWLYINMVFSLVVMMFLLPIFNRIFYRMTGNIWVGSITCCTIFIMMTISASVSYIPLY